ncbi:deubiquitinating protein VCIP135-like [Argonauta hians]
MGTWSEDQQKVLTGFCPDDQCRASLFFAEATDTVECVLCGRWYEKQAIHDVRKISDLSEVLKYLRPMLQEKRPEETKVMGISNYVCKLLSPLFTEYGLDRHTKEAKLLSEMGHGETFDCSRLGSHSFHIDPAHLDIPYYGIDSTGSLSYLSETLSIIKAANDNEDRLVPIHTDGDGHCLVYAISRALTGRELFWHALRQNLRHHFMDKLQLYKMHFEDFIHCLEWQEIIAECAPNFVPVDGEPLGLRNIHIFGLANVLRRPIILLDSIDGIRSSGDYSGVFLPAFSDPSECRGKDNRLNQPLCIAWNSNGRNHYIPLVGIQGKPLARVPRTLLQKAWGMPNHLISDYIDFDDNSCCVVGGDKPLSDKYMLQLVCAMKKVYTRVHGIHPCVVADVFQFLFKKSGIVGVKPDTVIATARKLIQERQLYRCINCEALTQYHLPLQGYTTDTAPTLICSCQHAVLHHCSPKHFSHVARQPFCLHCKSQHVRQVNSDGSLCYLNADRTLSKSDRSRCGYRHFWNGTEYDHLPDIFTIPLRCKQKTITATVEWFHQESDPQCNSNAFTVAEHILQEHFPGEFLSQLLIQYVADQLLQVTAHLAHTSSGGGGGGGGGGTNCPGDSSCSPKRKSTHTDSGSGGGGGGGGGSPKRKSASCQNQQKCQSGSSGLLMDRLTHTDTHTPTHRLTHPPADRLTHTDTHRPTDRLTHTDTSKHTPKDRDIHTHTQHTSRNSVSNQGKATSDVWKYSQENRQLFCRGGLYYSQVKLDRDCSHGAHFTLPALPGKVFVYNSTEDRLDICLKPFGHFMVEPGVEEKANRSKPQQNLDCPPSRSPPTALSAPNFRRGKKLTPSSEDEHPSKIFHCKEPLTSDKRGDLSAAPTTTTTTTTMNNEGRDSKKAVAQARSEQPYQAYQRLGPGFSVLDAQHSNITNQGLELLHTLAKNIDASIFDQFKECSSTHNTQNVDDDDDDLSSCGGSEDMDL